MTKLTRKILKKLEKKYTIHASDKKLWEIICNQEIASRIWNGYEVYTGAHWKQMSGTYLKDLKYPHIIYQYEEVLSTLLIFKLRDNEKWKEELLELL